MTEEFDPKEARLLWRQAAPATMTATATAVSPLDLAAWLDGKADPALAARVERAMLADDSLLQTALAARAAADSTEPAPERLLVRARAMVAPPVAAASRSGGGFLARLGAWQRRLEWAAIGACFMIVASGGFWLGGNLGDNVASAAEPASFTLLGVDEESYDLFDGGI